MDFYILLTVQSLYNLVNKANLVHSFFSTFISWYIYQSLHISGDYVPVIRRNNCVFATLGTCYSVWMTVWYARWTVWINCLVCTVEFHPAYQTVIHTE